MFKPFWLAVQFLTRFPTPHYDEISDKEMGASISWFPIVGLLIGVILAFVGQTTQWLPAQVSAGLLLAVWVWGTGALHLDGLADTADGWLAGSGDHQRALQVMKDSRIGTGGGVALVLVLLMKWSALVVIIEHQAWFLLLFAPVVARVASIVLMRVTQYVSEKGIAAGMFLHLNSDSIWLWFSLLTAAVVWLNPLLLVALILVWFWMRWVMIRITGGMTGDTAGAMTEVIELVWLMGIVAMLIN